MADRTGLENVRPLSFVVRMLPNSIKISKLENLMGTQEPAESHKTDKNTDKSGRHGEQTRTVGPLVKSQPH
jgi:hypothetical protein